MSGHASPHWGRTPATSPAPPSPPSAPPPRPPCGNGGIAPDFIPQRAVSEAVLAELSDRNWQGVPVLLPGSAIGRDALAAGLSNLGARVRRVAAYRNVRPEGVAETARAVLRRGVDAVTFTSSSTVRNLLDILGDDRHLLNGCLIAAIGPITAATARELQLPVDIIAADHNVPGLANALAHHFAADASPSPAPVAPAAANPAATNTDEESHYAATP